MRAVSAVIVVIVGFRSAADVAKCIYAIGLLRGEPFSAVSAAVRGLLAGVSGEIGRSDRLMGPKGWRGDG